MIDRLSSRRRAEQFARAVDGEASAYDAVLTPLVAVAGALRSVPEAAPSTRFRDSLRGSLLAAAVTELAPAPTGTAPADPAPDDTAPVRRLPESDDDRKRRRRLVAVAGSLVLVGGMSGAAAASQQALPGDTLYPVKRGIERIELGLAGSVREQGSERLEQADTRLQEVEQLSAGEVDDARVREDITTTLQRFATDAGQGGDLLVDSYEQTGRERDLLEVRRFTAAAAERLSGLADDLPAESQSALDDAVSVVETLDRMAIQACPTCTSGLPAVDLDLDLLSLPQAGDGRFLVPDVGDQEPRAREQGEHAGGTPAGGGDQQAPRRGDGSGVGATTDPGGGPLPAIPDDVLDGHEPADGGGSSGGGVLGDDGLAGTDGPVLGDDGVLGKDGPVLGDDGLAGTDGPVLGKGGVLGDDGPLKKDGLLGKNGPVLGDDGLAGTDGPVLGDDGVLGGQNLLGGD